MRVIVFPGRPGREHGASKLVKCSIYSNTLKINVIEYGEVPLSSKSLEHDYFNLIHSLTDFVFVFTQAIEIEKSAGQFDKIIGIGKFSSL